MNALRKHEKEQAQHPRNPVVLVHGRPIGSNGRIIFQPYRRPGNGKAVFSSSLSSALISDCVDELQASDALLIGELNATHTAVVGVASPSVSLREPLVITTPNADYLPDISVDPHVSIVIRRDGRFGTEDWTQ